MNKRVENQLPYQNLNIMFQNNFYIRIVLDLQNYYIKIVQRYSLIPHTQLSLLLTCYMNLAHLPQLNQHINIFLLTKVHNLFQFSQVFFLIFFVVVPGFTSDYHITFISHVTGSFPCESFSCVSCF